jgi:hypothetical protein
MECDLAVLAANGGWSLGTLTGVGYYRALKTYESFNPRVVAIVLIV